MITGFFMFADMIVPQWFLFVTQEMHAIFEFLVYYYMHRGSEQSLAPMKGILI